MFKTSVSAMLVALLLGGALLNDCAQNRGANPTIGIALEKVPDIRSRSFERFGLSCRKPAPVLQWIGAPIRSVTLRRYGPGWKNQYTVRNHLSKLLTAQTREVFTYEAWAEAVFADMIATIEFSDHTQRPLEISGPHVCFLPRSGTTALASSFC
ncbi:MAG: hypothetical protein DMG98_12390 [Acidobacteria bacterium]|nr:MAG: hypothetical protein DMG98_12390 [Acidobacteriota bacterium]